MAVYTKELLSGCTNGRMIKVVATSTAGTLIHTSHATAVDEIWLWAVNSTTGDLKLTIDAGTELSSSLDITVASLDLFVARFESDPDGPRGEPFDINDYRRTAMELTQAARQIDELVASVDQLLVTARPGEDESSFMAAVEVAEASGVQLIDHAFKRALVIVAVLVGGLAVVVLIGRLVPRKTPR